MSAYDPKWTLERSNLLVKNIVKLKFNAAGAICFAIDQSEI